jgi:hypothetical protein
MLTNTVIPIEVSVPLKDTLATSEQAEVRQEIALILDAWEHLEWHSPASAQPAFTKWAVMWPGMAWHLTLH